MQFRRRIKLWDCACTWNKKKAGWEDGRYTFCLLHRPGHPPSSLPQNAHDREENAADFFIPPTLPLLPAYYPPFYFQMTSLHVSSSSSSAKGMTCLGMCVNLCVCVCIYARFLCFPLLPSLTLALNPPATPPPPNHRSWFSESGVHPAHTMAAAAGALSRSLWLPSLWEEEERRGGAAQIRKWFDR